MADWVRYVKSDFMFFPPDSEVGGSAHMPAMISEMRSRNSHCCQTTGSSAPDLQTNVTCCCMFWKRTMCYSLAVSVLLPAIQSSPQSTSQDNFSWNERSSPPLPCRLGLSPPYPLPHMKVSPCKLAAVILTGVSVTAPRALNQAL